MTRFQAGIDVEGRPARFIKVELKGEVPRPLLLDGVTIWGGDKKY